MKLWRIAAETRKYTATDLSGKGAASQPGRWNDEAEPVVYCAPTISIAVLETAAHIDSEGFPQNRFVIEIDVPDDVWLKRREIALSDLPPMWDAIPAGGSSVKFGSNWLKDGTTAIMLIPSVIVPEECIALINPAHPQAALITARATRKFEFNRLLRA